MKSVYVIFAIIGWSWTVAIAAVLLLKSRKGEAP
jgi:hypothetical protein